MVGIRSIALGHGLFSGAALYYCYILGRVIFERIEYVSSSLPNSSNCFPSRFHRPCNPSSTCSLPPLVFFRCANMAKSRHNYTRGKTTMAFSRTVMYGLSMLKKKTKTANTSRFLVGLMGSNPIPKNGCLRKILSYPSAPSPSESLFWTGFQGLNTS